MKTTRICPKCLQPMPENAPEGLCPQCLAKAAFETEPAAQKPGNTPTPAELASCFPQLEIIELLGQGGMGIVYKARQPHLDRLVALKILPVDSAAHPSFAERFNREAKALAKLNHPGIVTVYDFGQTGQYYYFIMEYVDGMNLRGLLQSPVEPRQALELVVRICTGLQYAHDKGVVHRDIKPENILISKEGQVKIADFGLAKLKGPEPDTALTMSKEGMGTLNYMAPEQRQDAQKADHRADIYSLGVVFYEMLTGEVPMGRFEPPSKRVQVDVRLDEVVLKALEREPARRYQQVNEVKTGVETITSAMPRETSAVRAPEAFKPHQQPTFAKEVVKQVIPMLVVFLMWLAVLVFAPKSPFFRDLIFTSGLAVLAAGLPTAVFELRRKLASQGLRLKDLPPTVRRHAAQRITLAGVPCVILLFAGLIFGPSREQAWREDFFYPKSRAYEKLSLAGHISGYRIPFWSGRSLAGSGRMAIKIDRDATNAVTLTVTLPGLLLPQDPLDPSRPPQVLTLPVLTNWLHNSAQLDLAQPQVQAEAAQLMDLFEAYRDTAPGSWEEFAVRARGELRGFDFGGMQSNLWEAGGIPVLINALPIYIGLCLCLFYFLTLRSLKRAFTETRAEIEAGRWTPPRPENKPSGGVKSNETITVPHLSLGATRAPSQPRLSRMAIAGAGCFILLIGVFAYSSVFDLSRAPLNHRESVPSTTDAHGRIIATQEIEVSGPGTWWRVAVLVSIVLGAAAALGATTCGWVAATQIQRSSGELYGLGLALFDGLIVPLALVNFLVFLHGPIPGFILAAVNFFVIRAVWRRCRDGRSAVR